MDMMVMMSILEILKKKEEHVLNFKILIKRRIAIPRDKIKDARLLYHDYFKPDSVFH